MNSDSGGSVRPNRHMSEEADGHIGNRVKQLARSLADPVDAKLKVQGPMDALTQMAFVACTADIFTF